MDHNSLGFEKSFPYGKEGKTLDLRVNNMPAERALDMMVALPQLFSKVGASLAALLINEKINGKKSNDVPDTFAEYDANKNAQVDALIASGGDGLDDNDLDFSGKAEELMVLASSIQEVDRRQLTALVKELCEQCYETSNVKGKVVFGNVFTGKPPLLMWQVALWVLQVNFSDFFEGTGIGEKISGLL